MVIFGKFLDFFFKLCHSPASKILCRLFNRCIETGIFPKIFKIAKVTPIYKKGSRSELGNHRPVSVLPCLSKIFESIIFKRIQNYFKSKDFFNKNQYGFRKKRSTELAIFSLVDRMQIPFEKKCYGICIFLDHSKCFDIMNRDILISKLQCYGIRGIPLDLIQSYFEERKQCVVYNGQTSSLRNQNLGVVQGSKTGSLYYDIHTGDFDQLYGEGEFIDLMFAV